MFFDAMKFYFANKRHVKVFSYLEKPTCQNLTKLFKLVGKEQFAILILNKIQENYDKQHVPIKDQYLILHWKETVSHQHSYNIRNSMEPIQHLVPVAHQILNKQFPVTKEESESPFHVTKEEHYALENWMKENNYSKGVNGLLLANPCKLHTPPPPPPSD